MMLGEHAALGVAQTIFYVPVVVAAIWLMARNWAFHPRMAWWPMVPFSLMRLAGGPLVIALQNDKTNIGLYVAALVLLNVGAIPLIVALSGFVRIILMDNFPPSKKTVLLTKAMRISVIVAIALLSSGGSIISQDDENVRKIGRILQLAGYGLFAALLIYLIGALTRFWSMRRSLTPCSRRVIIGGLAASPFLIVRTIYGLLQVAFEFDIGNIWNPVVGSVAAFTLMALVVEYCAVGIYLYVGFSMPPGRGVSQMGNTENTMKDEEIPMERV